MNERYRWNEEQERRRAEEQARRERGQGPDLSGRDYYGVSGQSSEDRIRDEHERGDRPNHSWDGREPYPMDVGGINHPGDRGRGLDPLTGDRGSGERDHGRGYRGVQYGAEAVPQRDRGYSASEASRTSPGGGAYGAGGAYGRGEGYIEGGYEPRGRDHHYGELEHEARSWWARARDEFRAWMGDREAERRVRLDHAEDERYGRHGGDWQGHDDDTGWRDPISDDDTRRFDRSPREHRPGMFRDDR
jgi:hypothetical protein